jgi:hypothetical protein
VSTDIVLFGGLVSASALVSRYHEAGIIAVDFFYIFGLDDNFL